MSVLYLAHGHPRFARGGGRELHPARARARAARDGRRQRAAFGVALPLGPRLRPRRAQPPRRPLAARPPSESAGSGRLVQVHGLAMPALLLESIVAIGTPLRLLGFRVDLRSFEAP